MEAIDTIGIAFLITQAPEVLELANQFLKGFKKGLRALLGVFSCFKCVSFWVALIYTGNIFDASIVALIAFIIDNNLFNLRL